MGERLIFAIVLSLALHFALVIFIQGKPRETDATIPGAITARLEPAASVMPEVPVAALEEQASLPESSEPLAAESAAREPANAGQPLDAPLPAQKTEPVEPSTALEVPVIRDPTYHLARFLDEYPRPLRPILPRYPAQAKGSNVSGSVTLLLLIDENGVLREMSVVEAIPESIFNEAALEAFRDMPFSPARKDGRAVRSRVHVTVGFEANEPQSSVR